MSDRLNAVISRFDVATAYGWGLDALSNGLMSGKTAYRATQRFAERGFVSDQVAAIPELSPDKGGIQGVCRDSEAIVTDCGKD